MAEPPREPLDRETGRRLASALEDIVAHRIVRIHNSVLKVMAFQFLRGLAFGLGTVIGASILVSVLVAVLARIEFVPLLGDLASRVIEQIQDAQGSSEP
ncbi:DUF5665 domain-containing protein [Rhodosalinus sp.]|uniref:DUF5665 domain-containing protein n=1 Tax=Rhodosalinus sp. TaxID=2047741 RepID=UPI0035687E0D